MTRTRVICKHPSTSAPFHMTSVFSVFSFSDCSQLPSQSSRLSHSHRLRAALSWKKRRVHHLLRPGGGHRHLHLRTHVSVQRLWAEAEETDQCMLSNMQEAYQRCNQNLSAMMFQMFKQVLRLPQLARRCLDATNLLFSGPNRRLATPGHNCAYRVSILCG